MVESVEVHGLSYTIGDILISFGTILKNNSLTKEVLLRIELKSVINTSSIDEKYYQSLVQDIFMILGERMTNCFCSQEHLDKLSQFLRKESNSLNKTSKLIFDQNSIAVMYCLLFFNST
jgi:hypothetical protein